MNGSGIFHILVYVLEFLIVFNLVFPVLLFLFWKISCPENKVEATHSDELDYAIIITAYEQTHFIPDVIRSVLGVNYSKYVIYIIADNCAPSDDLLFDSNRIKVLFPEVVLASNISSHFYAINNFVRDHDVLLIMDSDNLAHPELINQLNIQFNSGFEAVQGVRLAKNLDTTIACLDAARDIYYHFYDGEMLFGLGSSATLSGSGMAFRVNLYRHALQRIQMTGAGFDKVLQAQILNDNKRIAFNANAIVYDQKTANSNQLVHQRSRWINTWFRFFKFGFSLVSKGIVNFNRNQFLFGLTLLRPPLFIFLSLAVLLIFLNFFIDPWVSIVLAISLVIFILGFFIPLLIFKTDKRIFNALLYIPVFVFYQIISLAKSMMPNKKNVATKHSQSK